MSIPAGHCRVSFVGHQTSSEIFDTSFWVLGAADSLNSAQALADGVASAWSANHGGLIATINANSGYDAVRVYAYPNGGTKSTWVAEASLGAVPGGGTQVMPLQLCLVLTLRTPQVGRSNRGRMYLPGDGLQLSGQNNQIVSTLATGAAQDMVAIFNAVNAMTIGGGNPVVSVVSFTETRSSPVTTITVDNKPDIQRRRANRQAHSIVGSFDLS